MHSVGRQHIIARHQVEPAAEASSGAPTSIKANTSVHHPAPPKDHKASGYMGLEKAFRNEFPNVGISVNKKTRTLQTVPVVVIRELQHVCCQNDGIVTEHQVQLHYTTWYRMQNITAAPALLAPVNGVWRCWADPMLSRGRASARRYHTTRGIPDKKTRKWTAPQHFFPRYSHLECAVLYHRAALFDEPWPWSIWRMAFEGVL